MTKRCECGALERHRLVEEVEKAARRAVANWRDPIVGTDQKLFTDIEQALKNLDDFESRKAKERAEPDIWPPDWMDEVTSGRH